VQEGAYFGNVMRAASDGTVHAWYCDGRDYTKGIVPGRLGADKTSSLYRNPWGAGSLCDAHCTAHAPDGYTSCNGVSNPITVWRQASYDPVFDNNYIYKLVNVKSGLSMDVTGAQTTENTPVGQYADNGKSTQRFQVFQVAKNQWKIIDRNSGKAITNRNGAGSTVDINAYNGNATDNWSIDDHNGHFIIRNKATNGYLQGADSCRSANLVTTTNYTGGPDTDWDLFAVDSL
jgi:Ricin-type beta-trefoil lectin domain-like